MTNDTDIVGGCFECGSPHGMILKQGDGPTCIKCNPDLAADLIEKQRAEIAVLWGSLNWMAEERSQATRNLRREIGATND